MITSDGAGNPALTNLPRKINIGISTTRDDFAHCHINDVGLKVGGGAWVRGWAWVAGVWGACAGGRVGGGGARAPARRDDVSGCGALGPLPLPTHPPQPSPQAVADPATGEVGFNVELGGYFSIKRNVVSIPGNTFLTQDQVVPYCKALLEVFRCVC